MALSPNTNPVFDLYALRQAIDRASDRVKAQLAPLPREAAEATVAFARAKYPIGPVHTGRTFSKRTGWGALRDLGGGTLRDSVVVGQPRGAPVSAGGVPIPIAIARVTAPHVHFYEAGTRPRYDATRRNPRTGQGAARGAAPAHGPIFVDTARLERDRMEARAQAILDRDVEL